MEWSSPVKMQNMKNVIQTQHSQCIYFSNLQRLKLIISSELICIVLLAIKFHVFFLKWFTITKIIINDVA